MAGSADSLSGLHVAECLARLRSARVGTVLFSHGALPAAAPVYYVLDEEDILFRVGEGTPVARATDDAVVSLYVQDMDADAACGWHVTVTGIARRARPDDERVSARDLPAWRGEDPTLCVRLVPSRVTGQRVGIEVPPDRLRRVALAMAGKAKRANED